MRELNQLIDSWSRILDDLTLPDLARFVVFVVFPVAFMLAAYDIFRSARKRRNERRVRGFEVDTTPKP